MIEILLSHQRTLGLVLKVETIAEMEQNIYLCNLFAVKLPKSSKSRQAQSCTAFTECQNQIATMRWGKNWTIGFMPQATL